MVDNFDDLDYGPSQEDLEFINNTINKNKKKKKMDTNSRVFYEFSSEDHFIGWLKVNGIKW